MAEYIITPEKKELPPGTYLMEELHRLGIPVEINVKGSPLKWDAIRFYEPGPPEIECFVSFDPDTGRINVSVSTDAAPTARDLQLSVTGLLLEKLGGQADNSATRERYSAEQFAVKMKLHHAPPHHFWDMFWLVFSWAVVVLGFIMYFSIDPTLRSMDITIVVLALASAVGLTLTKIHS